MRRTTYLQVLTALIPSATVSLPARAGDGLGGDRIDELKAEIIATASANTTRLDNLADVRSQLQPLVDELESLVPQRSEADKLAQVVGSWQNRWTDMYFGPTVDLTHTYQIVSARGFYYNVSRQIAGKAVETDFLRGTYADQGDHLAIAFTREQATSGWPPAGTDLVQLAALAESGQLGATDVPSHAVGVSGTLTDAFVDKDLRIVTGSSAEAPQTKLFVLTPAATIE